MQVRGPKSGFRRTIKLRRKLRHDLTPAEKLFWSKVANQQLQNLKFRKQHGIGSYVVDFYCPEKKLVVEIDGDSHAMNIGIKYDAKRTQYLERLGYRIIRYQNREVMNNAAGVFEDLANRLRFL